jgi:hypothetical protein
MTLCGRRWVESTMELIESNHERPTCQHCIQYWERHRQGSITVPEMTKPKEAPDRYHGAQGEADTPSGFALRHAVVREGSALPCRWQDIINAQQTSFTTKRGNVVAALHIWWWGLDPND